LIAAGYLAAWDKVVDFVGRRLRRQTVQKPFFSAKAMARQQHLHVACGEKSSEFGSLQHGACVRDHRLLDGWK